MKSRLKNVYVLYSISARTAFEKMTDVDYQGETYYTIRNLSLYECQVSSLFSKNNYIFARRQT